MEKKETHISLIFRNLQDFLKICRENKALAPVFVLILLVVGLSLLPEKLWQWVWHSPVQTTAKFSPSPDAPRTPVDSKPDERRNITPNSIDSLVTKELYNKDLMEKLHNAATRLNPDSDAEAILRLYRGVLDQLSPDAFNKLDRSLVIGAETDFQAGRNGNAIEKYRQLFSRYQ